MTAPVAPTFALNTDSGTPADGITNDATVDVTLAEVGGTWEYSLDGGANWTTGMGTSFELADDTTYAIDAVQVREIDDAGNTGAAASNAAAITTDMTAPVGANLSAGTATDETDIVLTFGEDISLLDPTLISLFDTTASTQVLISSVVAQGTDSLLITTLAPMTIGNDVDVVVATGAVEDIAGNDNAAILLGDAPAAFTVIDVA